MKRAIAAGLLAVLALCGCQVKEINEPAAEREAKVFTATIEGNDFPETKTSLDDEGNVLWKQGDQVGIFVSSSVIEQYQVTDESDGKTTAVLNRVTSPDPVDGTNMKNNVAYYPYTATAGIIKIDGGYVISGITLPATQNYAEGSFGNGAFPMAAVTSSADDYNLKFKNVLGGLKLQLKGTAKIMSISIQGNSNEILCGEAEVTVANGVVPSISLTDASAKTVTLDCGNGVQLNAETATSFIIALPAMTMEGGFTVTVTDDADLQMEIKTTKQQIIARSNILKMPALTYAATSYFGHQFVDLGLPSGLKWAACNVGANSPEECGDYFAWGEIEPYYSSQDPLTWKEEKSAGYHWTSYKWYNVSNNTLTKYTTDKGGSYTPLPDNKTTLEMEDDAARANWRGSWRMPTDAEWTELRTECTGTSTTQNGVSGILVTGPNGNSMFLPAAGGYLPVSGGQSGLSNKGSYGGYWSSSLDTGAPRNALTASFVSSLARDSDYRYYGLSVRPVW